MSALSSGSACHCIVHCSFTKCPSLATAINVLCINLLEPPFDHCAAPDLKVHPASGLRWVGHTFQSEDTLDTGGGGPVHPVHGGP